VPQLEATKSKSDLFVLKFINVTKQQSPVVAQYNIKGVPTCMVYDPDGELLETSSEACWAIGEDAESLKQL
jgi:hypothetical protein